MKKKIQGITVKFIDDCQDVKYAIYCMKFSSKVYIGQTTGTIENRMWQSDDYRSKMSNAAKQNWQKEEYRNIVYAAKRNHKNSEKFITRYGFI